jgi:abnormal spindle-like microcephaly-associated protein
LDLFSDLQGQNKAAITIQSAYKGYVERKNFTSLKQAAMTCQKTFRAHVLGLNVRREFLIRKGAIITLQTGFRGLVM